MRKQHTKLTQGQDIQSTDKLDDLQASSLTKKGLQRVGERGTLRGWPLVVLQGSRGWPTTHSHRTTLITNHVLKGETNSMLGAGWSGRI